MTRLGKFMLFVGGRFMSESTKEDVKTDATVTFMTFTLFLLSIAAIVAVCGLIYLLGWMLCT